MLRRTALASFGGIVATGLAGCITGDPGETTTQTQTEIVTATPPPKTPSGPFVRYLVYNDDDKTHPLDVIIENAAGEVVHRRSDTKFAPGEQLGAISSGYDPENGPFRITFSLESVATTLDWKVGDCPRFDLLVAVTSEGPLEIERELCL